MNILNISTDNLQKMETRDALNFINFFTSAPLFKDAEVVYPGLFTVEADPVFNLMCKVTVAAQVFETRQTASKYYILTYSRAKDFSCINGINVKTVDQDDWKAEALRLRELTK